MIVSCSHNHFTNMLILSFAVMINRHMQFFQQALFGVNRKAMPNKTSDCPAGYSLVTNVQYFMESMQACYFSGELSVVHLQINIKKLIVFTFILPLNMSQICEILFQPSKHMGVHVNKILG